MNEIRIKHFRRFIFSFDLLISIFTAISILVFSPKSVSIVVMKEIYDVSIATFSIIFSIFFSALAILISTGDNEFVNYLEKDGTYSEIIWSYKVTLISLFISLILSIFLYIKTQFLLQSEIEYYAPRWINLLFASLSAYSLSSTFQATFDIIKYAKYRTKYNMLKSKINN